MKTEAEWNRAILNITMKIHQEFPELSKFIAEMPVKISERDEKVSIVSLKNYYISLGDLLHEYSKTHSVSEV